MLHQQKDLVGCLIPVEVPEPLIVIVLRNIPLQNISGRFVGILGRQSGGDEVVNHGLGNLGLVATLLDGLEGVAGGGVEDRVHLLTLEGLERGGCSMEKIL